MAEFLEELPEDPRRSGWGQEWHAPDGRVSHIQEVEGPGILRVGERSEQLSQGDFIVWQDGEYRAVAHDEVMSGAWEPAGLSSMELDALNEQEAEDEKEATEEELGDD